MGKKLAFGSAVATLAMALTLGHSTLVYAQDASAVLDTNFSAFDDQSSAASDDIYAVLTPEARRGGGPGGPPGPGGPGGPPPGHGGGGGGGWGPPPGHGGGGGWHRPRGVQCRAVNGRGIVFYGQGRNMPEARDAAMWSCQRASRRCYMDGCNPI